MKIYIRTDGNNSIGLGHLIRCISLAYILENEFEISFLCRSIPEKLISEIKKNGWNLILLNSENELSNFLTGKEILILDGYNFDSEHQSYLKKKVLKLVCIDDLHNQRYHADIIINHAPGVSESDYLASENTTFFLGPNYALLRPEFFSASKKKVFDKDKIEKLLVCFGGGDPKNFSGKILQSLPSNPYEVVIIVGSSFESHKELDRIISDRNDLRIEKKSAVSALEMVDQMKKADVGIFPASGILLESVFLGLPAVSGICSENQRDMFNGFKELGAIIDGGLFDIQQINDIFMNIDKKQLGEVYLNQVSIAREHRLKKDFLSLVL